MKNLILFVFTIFSLASCVRSPEGRINDLIQKNVRGSLSFPRSYQAISTVIDSAYAPGDDPVFYTKVAGLRQLLEKKEACEFDAARARRVMNIWKEPSEYGLGHVNYEHYKQEIEDCARQIDFLSTKIDAEWETLRKASVSDSIIGYKVTHMYRAKTGSGSYIVREKVFIIDRDMSQILAVYDTNDRDYQAVRRICQTIIEP